MGSLLDSAHHRGKGGITPRTCRGEARARFFYGFIGLVYRSVSHTLKHTLTHAHAYKRRSAESVRAGRHLV